VRPGARAWIHPDGPDAAADEVWACLEAALACPIGLILGPHGSGKSTLLRHVIALAEDRGRAVAMVHRDGAVPSLAAIRRLELVATDAAGRLRPVWWPQLVLRCRRAGTPLLLTAHREWFGRTVHRRRVGPRDAAAVVADCLRGTGAEVPPEDELALRLREARGSVRAVLWSLYDDWERGAAPAPGWPRPEA
jgi:energy-coupling factor transporter ATP-binding protein EcfA2